VRMPTELPQAEGPRLPGLRLPVDRRAGDVGQGLARGLEQVQDVLDQEQDQQDQFALAAARTRLRAEETDRLGRAGDETGDDQVDGFAQRFGEGFDQRAATVRAQLPPRVQAEFDLDAQGLRAELGAAATSFERDRRVTRNTRVLDQTLEDSARTLARDPNSYDAVLAGARQAVNAAGLPAEARDARFGVGAG
jgi:hypothetical protein